MNTNNILKNKASIVYFSSPDCNVCDALKPKVFKAIKEKFKEFEIFDIDISKDPKLATDFNVFCAPTVLVLFEGKEFIRKSRAFSVEELLQNIQRPYEIMFG